MKKNKPYTLRKKIQYELDDFISKGFMAQLALLVGCVLVITLAFGFIMWFFIGKEDLEGSLWQSLMHVIDQGTITGDSTDNKSYLFLMLGATIIGMGFTAAIIGIISNGINSKMDEMNKGHSYIIEKNHAVVLGFNEHTHTISGELEDSNKKKKGNHCIVIVGDIPKDEMEHTYKEVKWSRRKPGEDETDVFRAEKNKSVIFRSGDLISENTFIMCAADRARTIIVNGSDDFETVRILLALVTFLKKADAYIYSKRMPSVVAVIHNRENLSAAKIAADVYHDGENEKPNSKNEYKVRILYFKEIISRLFAQVCVRPELSRVLNDILNGDSASFFVEDKTAEGNEEREKAFLGKNIAEIRKLVRGCIPVGFSSLDENRRIRMDLNPLYHVRYGKGDRLIYLADDRDDLKLAENAELSPVGAPAPEGTRGEYEIKHFLIMGWSSELPGHLKNMNEYSDGRSGIEIITRENDGPDSELDLFDSHSLIRSDPYNWDTTVRILNEHPCWFDPEDERHLTNIVILSENEKEEERPDEKVMVLLLNMREYLNKHCSFDISITTEIRLPQNQTLVQNTRENDFIIGTQVASRFMVQVAEDPKKYFIFEELFGQRGEVVEIRPFSDYIDTGVPFNFEGISREVLRKGEETGEPEIALGWMILNRNGAGMEEQEYSLLNLHPSDEERTGIFADRTGNGYKDHFLILLAPGNRKDPGIG